MKLIWGVAKALVFLVVACEAIYLVATKGCSSGPGASGHATGAVVKLPRTCAAMPSHSGWERLRKEMLANDTAAMARVLLTGGGAFLDPGTTVMVKEPGLFSIQISVQDVGPHFGKTFYVENGCL